jgi:hypothetical protein
MHMRKIRPELAVLSAVVFAVWVAVLAGAIDLGRAVSLW